MEKSEQERIDFNKWFRWHFIKTFYLINKEELLLMYERINSVIALTPANWNKFVSGKDLHDFVYHRVTLLSMDLLDAIAYGERAENLGMEIHAEDCVMYIAIPMFHYDNVQSIADQRGTIRQIATRNFITMLCHMFFKDLYSKPFTILKEYEGWLTLNENYEYVKK